MAALNAAGASYCGRWPTPGISTRHEPGIASASARLQVGPQIQSCSPTITSVGQRILAKSGRELRWHAPIVDAWEGEREDAD